MRIPLFVSFLCFSLVCFASAVQLFIEPLSEAICNKPLNLKLYVLDEQGNVDIEYDGVKNLDVRVEEKGGEKRGSFRIPSQRVSFKKGIGVFIVEDSEPEELKLTINLEDIRVPASVSLSFEDKDIFPPVITSIMVEKTDVIILKFNEQVDEEYALDTANYIAITNKREVHPQRVEYHKDYVVLKFPVEFDQDEEGYIELEEMRDLSGNEISPGLRSPDFDGDCGC